MYPYSSQRVRYSSSNTSVSASETSLQTDSKLLELIVEAIDDEQEDSEYYQALMNIATTQTDKDILRSIHLDELKHKKMFEEIHFMLTGKKAPLQKTDIPELSKNLLSNYEERIFEELEAVDSYRQMLFSILNSDIRDMLLEIISDEQKHATKLTYLYSKNKTK